jgi:Transposase
MTAGSARPLHTGVLAVSSQAVACGTAAEQLTERGRVRLRGGCSNGPTEAVNLLIKKLKRVGHGFRNFANYRLRLLLHCGIRWQTHQTARLQGRSPRLVA